MEKSERDAIEGELIDLVHGHEVENFVLTITRRDKMFDITLVDLDVERTDPPSDKMVGKGHSFAEAWQNFTPTWAKGGEK